VFLCSWAPEILTDAMSLLQTVQLEHLPPTYAIHIALYRNVTNAAFLQQQLLAGNTDFEYALIDAGVVRVPFSTPLSSLRTCPTQILYHHVIFNRD
jgi:hypothetical protein